jgi:hypothetical protein
VYTPDDLGVEDPDADVTPVDQEDERAEPAPAAAAATDQEDADVVVERVRALNDAANKCGVAIDTVVELCLFYYDQPDLAALTRVQAAEMADRLRYATRMGIDDAKLARLAARGLAMDDRAKAAEAADVWLTTRSATEDAGAPKP